MNNDRANPGTSWQLKATRYKWMSWFWLFPSTGAVWILIQSDSSWFEAASLGQALGTVRIEQWVALAILVTHVVWVGLAVYHRRHEPARPLLRPESEDTERRERSH